MPRELSDAEREDLDEGRRRYDRLKAAPGLATLRAMSDLSDRLLEVCNDYLEQHEGHGPKTGGADCPLCEEFDLVYDVQALRFLTWHVANVLRNNFMSVLDDDDQDDDDGPDDDPCPQPDDPCLVGCA